MICHSERSLREASHIDFVREKRHMNVLRETLPPPPPPFRNIMHFFLLCRGLWGIIYQWRLKNWMMCMECKSTLGEWPGSDNEHTNILKIQIHMRKCRISYTLYRWFQNIKNFQQTIKIFYYFSPRNVTGAKPLPPLQRPYDVSRGQNWYVTLP